MRLHQHQPPWWHLGHPLPGLPDGETHGFTHDPRLLPREAEPAQQILMLANSPDSPPSRMDALAEEDEEYGPDASPTPAPVAVVAPAPVKSLAEELGIIEDDDNPMLDKRVGQRPGKNSQTTHSDAPRPTAKEKGKGRAQAEPTAPSRARAGGHWRRRTLSGQNSRTLAPSSGSGAKAAATAQDVRKVAKVASNL
ncbi:hypothetical protein A0H81_06406 [Grifola frondosa]|uniref:Uncharacterized protein n=1 Tax=Grifola frondosa TaxID=5627 RepID=A0A1C7M9N8_GRIFR|nr:hypothetical protein A0H81_06406 [Grifola frondosa]